MDDFLDPAKPLYDYDRVIAVRLKNGMELEFDEGTFRELRSRESDTEVFVGELLFGYGNSSGTIKVCGPSSLIELVYFNSTPMIVDGDSSTKE
jgi:hypothetical protein